MQDYWQNKNFAEDWDKNTSQTNPKRDLQLKLLVGIVAGGFKPGNALLDLGYGSGQVEEILFMGNPGIEIVGVDNSEEMMNLAKSRLENKKFTAIKLDLAKINELKLPAKQYQFVISVQTLHHLTTEQKQNIFNFSYKLLEPGGSFLLIDKCNPEFRVFYKAYEALYAQTHPDAKESFDEYIKRHETKYDYPASVAEQLAWLKQAGFESACLNLNFDWALLIGQK